MASKFAIVTNDVMLPFRAEMRILSRMGEFLSECEEIEHKRC